MSNLQFCFQPHFKTWLQTCLTVMKWSWWCSSMRFSGSSKTCNWLLRIKTARVRQQNIESISSENPEPTTAHLLCRQHPGLSENTHIKSKKATKFYERQMKAVCFCDIILIKKWLYSKHFILGYIQQFMKEFRGDFILRCWINTRACSYSYCKSIKLNIKYLCIIVWVSKNCLPLTPASTGLLRNCKI